MAGSTRRWSKRKYQEHIFDLARKKPSRHADDNKAAKSRGWFNLTFDQDSMSDMFEENSVRGSEGHAQARDASGETYTSWNESGATERERFRQDQQEALKKQFRQNISKHPAFRNKTSKEIGEIADAYLSGNDYEGKENAEVADALKEVADYTTGDGEVSMSDERAWRQKYPREAGQQPAGQQPAGQQPAGQQPAGQQQPGPKNGTSQKQSGKDPPLTRRGAKAPADPTVTPVRKLTTSGVVAVDGVPDFNQTETRGKLEAAVRNKAAVLEANSNTARKDAAYAERRADRTRESQELRDRMERADDFERWRSQRNERIKQERADTRFRNRTLSNREDWENLGQAKGNNRDYTKAAQGETDEQFQAAVKERNDRVAALKDRIAQMTDTTLLKKGEKAEWVKGHNDAQGNWVAGRYKVMDAKGNEVNADEVAGRETTGVGDDGLTYANEVYANAPKRMQAAKEVQKLMESAGGNITDAQIEGANGMLDKWQSESDVVGKRRANAERERQVERMARLRKQYGMEGSGYSDALVEGYHKRTQEAERKKILQDMDVMPGQDNEERAGRMGRYADNWEKLVKTGFDPQKAFDDAMKNKITEASFYTAMDKIEDGPEKADKVDQLRRRFILNHAMEQAGLRGQRVGNDVIGDNLPGRQAMAGGKGLDEMVSRAEANGSAYDVQIAKNMRDEINGQMQSDGDADSWAQSQKDLSSENAGNLPQQPQLPPQMRNIPVPPKKKPEELQQAAKGGDALRPRRRR